MLWEAVRDLAAVVVLEATAVVVLEATAVFVFAATVVFFAAAVLDAAPFAATLLDVPALCFTAVLVGAAAVCATHKAAPLNIAAARQIRVAVVHLHLRAIYAASPNLKRQFVRPPQALPTIPHPHRLPGHSSQVLVISQPNSAVTPPPRPTNPLCRRACLSYTTGLGP
jgi:hypothetical protein